MKKTLLITSLLLAVSLLLFLSITKFSQPKVAQKSILDIERPRMDGPAKYSVAHRLIRTNFGDEGPRYNVGDQIKAFDQAKRITRSKGDALNWENRGPGNVGGRTRGLIVVPTDSTSKTWITGTAGGGVWRTSDGGDTWELLTKDLPNLSTTTLAMSDANPDVIYAGTGEGFFNIDGITGSGIWKSSDNGETWNVLESTLDNKRFRNVTRMIINPNDENELVICTMGNFENGNRFSYIMKTIDGGENWTIEYLSNQYIVQQLVYPVGDFSTQYAAVRDLGILKSVDQGDSWDQVFDIEPFSDIRRIEMAISPTDAGVIYLSCEEPGGSRLFATRDTFHTTTNVIYETFQANWLGGQGWYDNTIAVHPYNDSLVWVAGAGTMLQIRTSSKFDTIRIFDSFENGTDFIDPIEENFFGSPSAGLATDLFEGLPISTETTQDDITNVEVRTGPGIVSKAHLIDVDIFTQEASYNSMIDVPFQAWDTMKNEQIAMSIFDVDGNGIWTFEDFTGQTGVFSDFVLVNALPYLETANENIEINPVYKALYYMLLGRDSSYVGSVDSLPEGFLWFSTKEDQGLLADFRPITDGYGQYFDLEFVGSKGVHVDHHNIIMIPKDSASQNFYVLNANDGGVAFSEDSGESFRQTGYAFRGEGLEPFVGYNVSQWYGIDKKNGEDRFVGGTQDNGSWVSPIDPDENSVWVEAPSGDGFEAAWNYDNGDLLLETSQFNGLYKSYDGGENWSFVNLPPSQGPFITRVASSQIDADLVFMVADTGLLRSEDFAETWEIIEMPGRWEFHRSWGAITKISLAHSNIVWSGSGMSNNNRMTVSTDRGLSFSVVNDYDLADRGTVTGMATHPIDSATAYVLFSQADGPKILRTTDLGQNWEDLSGFVTNETESSNGFPDVAVYSLLVMPFDEDRIWVGTEIGIFESLDGGESWDFADNGLPPVSIWEMKIVNDQIVIATHGRGIWTLNTAELQFVDTKNVDASLFEMKLSPNPMSDISMLSFEISNSSNVDVSIFSFDGKLIQNILRDNLPAGAQNIQIDRNRMLSGMYLIRLQIDNQVATHKLVVE